jgi:hypothetical protein
MHPDIAWKIDERWASCQTGADQLRFCWTTVVWLATLFDTVPAKLQAWHRLDEPRLNRNGVSQEGTTHGLHG